MSCAAHRRARTARRASPPPAREAERARQCRRRAAASTHAVPTSAWAIARSTRIASRASTAPPASAWPTRRRARPARAGLNARADSARTVCAATRPAPASARPALWPAKPEPAARSAAPPRAPGVRPAPVVARVKACATGPRPPRAPCQARRRHADRPVARMGPRQYEARAMGREHVSAARPGAADSFNATQPPARRPALPISTASPLPRARWARAFRPVLSTPAFLDSMPRRLTPPANPTAPVHWASTSWVAAASATSARNPRSNLPRGWPRWPWAPC